MKWKPTKEEKAAIRNFAARLSNTSVNRITIEAGIRAADDETHVNVLRFSEETETTLHDFMSWGDVVRGVEANDAGEVSLDLYVYSGSRGDRELETNFVAYAAMNEGVIRLVALQGVSEENPTFV